MAKNILLMFLSNVNFSRDETGKSKVSVATYKDIGTTKTTNESAVRYLAQVEKAKPSKIFYFASKKVRNASFTENGENFTHVSYFERRIADCVDGTIGEVMQPCNFDENADIQQTMKAVIEMASMIQKYAAENEEVILHVDMTGGLRHASLMMLVIARLIQYSGVKIGYILYSNFVYGREENFVEEANDIYDMFNLIAGAEEFVRFGSVEAILSYFNNKDIPKELEELLKAMKNFAEAIKISRRKEFHDALQGLQDAYKKFSDAEKDFSTMTEAQSMNYDLMQQLKIRIAKEYSTLLECSADDYVSIIDWCLDHGYIQQALVLYTESFPYLIIAKDEILSVNSAYDKELDKKVSEDGMKREREYLLLNDFDPPGYDYKPIFNAYQDFVEKLKSAFEPVDLMTKFKKENSSDYWVGLFYMIQSDYDDYLELIDDLLKLKDNPNLAADLETIKNELPTLYSFWYLIPEKKAKKIFREPVNKRLEKISKAFKEVVNLRKRNNNTLIVHYLIATNVLQLKNIDEETFLLLVDRYFTIKSERNDSVHARKITKKGMPGSSDAGTSYADLLRNYMKEGLQEYSRIIKEIKG